MATPAQVKTAADTLNTDLTNGDATVAEINADTAAPGLGDSLLTLCETLTNLLADTGRAPRFQKGIKLLP